MKDLFKNQTEHEEKAANVKALNEEAVSEIENKNESEAISGTDADLKSKETEKEKSVFDDQSSDNKEDNSTKTKITDNPVIKSVKKTIKKSGILDPDSLKDMFFGAAEIKNAEDSDEFINDKEDFSDESDEVKENIQVSDDENENDEEFVSFSKRRKKRISADPEKDKVIFSFEYMVTPDMALDGYLLFYNEFIKKNNIKWTFLFGILSLIFLISILFSPSSYLNYFLLLICVLVIAMKWLNSYNAKKSAVLSADDVKNDSYKLSFYNSRILIEASELAGDRVYNYPPVMIRFEDINLKVIDYEGFYVLIFKNDYIYTIPKESMSEKMNEVFKGHLKNILGDDYREYYNKNED